MRPSKVSSPTPLAGQAADDETTLSIRAYRSDDRHAIERIAWTTALMGASADAFCDDPGVLTICLTGYYLEAEPEGVFVACAGDRVAGYVTACARPRHLARYAVCRLAPRLLAALPRVMIRRPRTRQFAWRMLCDAAAGRLLSPAAVRTCRGHLHVNLDRAFRGRGLGTRLMRHALDYLDRHGARPVGVRVAAESRAIVRLNEKFGFSVVAESAVRYWSHVTGTPTPIFWMVRP